MKEELKNIKTTVVLQNINVLIDIRIKGHIDLVLLKLYNSIVDCRWLNGFDKKKHIYNL